jgi:hypothetical protein
MPLGEINHSNTSLPNIVGDQPSAPGCATDAGAAADPSFGAAMTRCAQGDDAGAVTLDQMAEEMTLDQIVALLSVIDGGIKGIETCLKSALTASNLQDQLDLLLMQIYLNGAGPAGDGTCLSEDGNEQNDSVERTASEAIEASGRFESEGQRWAGLAAQGQLLPRGASPEALRDAIAQAQDEVRGSNLPVNELDPDSSPNFNYLAQNARQLPPWRSRRRPRPTRSKARPWTDPYAMPPEDGQPPDESGDIIADNSNQRPPAA